MECYPFSSITAEDGIAPLPVFTLADQHSRVRKALGQFEEFVVHSLRHAFGTRLGGSGAGAFTMMRLMGGADIYQIAKNCRTSAEMIEKYYAAHIKTNLDAADINIMRPKKTPKPAKRAEPNGAADPEN